MSMILFDFITLFEETTKLTNCTTDFKINFNFFSWQQNSDLNGQRKWPTNIPSPPSSSAASTPSPSCRPVSASATFASSESSAWRTSPASKSRSEKRRWGSSSPASTSASLPSFVSFRSPVATSRRGRFTSWWPEKRCLSVK